MAEGMMQPSLTLEECSEEGRDDPHGALVDQVRTSEGSNREALAYLLRYETMVRQQEAEDMATMAHIRPCVERLQELAGTGAPTENENNNNNFWSDVDSQVLTNEISFAELKKALDKLEEQDSAEFLTTDRQLMMVLRMLTQKTTEMDADVRITWAEFLQCYKVCIGGMQALQHVPTESRVRARTRDRTLSMLSLFEPPSTKLFTDEGHTIDSGALTSERHYRSKAQGLSKPTTSKRRSKKKKRTLAVAMLGILVAAVYYLYNSQSTTTDYPPTITVKDKAAPEQVVKPRQSLISKVTHQEQPAVAQLTPSIASFAQKPVIQPVVQPLRSKPIEVRSLPPAPLRGDTKTFVSTSTPDHLPLEMESVTAPALVGGVLGVLGAPLLIAGMQVLVAGLASGSLLSMTVFAVGIASIVRGMWTLVKKLFAKS